jgi:DeoR/GlpR family transcriptional regulator of sugar metabolism
MSSRVKDNRQSRITHIFAELIAGKSVTVSQLGKLGNIGERTARTDIANLLALISGFKRIRGGISPGTCESGSDYYAVRARSENIEAKQDVATHAARVFTPGSSVAASPGSTVALTYGAMLEQGIGCPIVTNSLAIAEHGANPGSQIYLVAGQYSPNIHGTIGDDAVKGFSNRPCRVGVVGVSGFSLNKDGKFVLRVQHDAEVPVLCEMLESIQETIVIVVNIQKLGRVDPWQIGTLVELKESRKNNYHRNVIVVTNDFSEWKDELKDGIREEAQRVFKALTDLANGDQIKLIRALRR